MEKQNIMIKKTVITLYILTILVMATASIMEHTENTLFASKNFYGAWWFSLLWAMLVAFGIIYIIKSKLKKWNIILLHLSMIVILFGAFLTHTTSFTGMAHLRGDQPTNRYEKMSSMTDIKSFYLPFSIKLDKFTVNYHSGTTAASDYTTHFTIIDGPKTIHALVSMNKIYTYKSIRFYQASYDTDHLGSYLSVNSDPYGTTTTYIGYSLLFFSLLWLLIDPQGTFHKLLKSDIIRKGSLLLMLFVGAVHIQAATTINKVTADKFGQLFINYNNRICPIQTFGIDFTKKIYGNSSFQDATAEQVLMSWIFYQDEWDNEPIIKIRSSKIRKYFNLKKYTSLQSFFKNGNYILGPYIEEYNQGERDALHKECNDLDGNITLIMALKQGLPLTIFPFTKNGKTIWYSPADSITGALPHINVLMIKNIFPLLYSELYQANTDRVNTLLNKLLIYQNKNGGTSIPSKYQVKAERIYNNYPFASILFIVNLTLGFATLLLTINRLTRKQQKDELKYYTRTSIFMFIILVLSFLALTFGLALRWIISGNVPLSNGYETTLITAWFVMLFTIITTLLNIHLISIITTFGFLLSGFFLLVSHINEMDPAIGQIMPVLNSPLLSIHVSIIMMSYALLSLTFICGITGIVLYIIHHIKKSDKDNLQSQLYALQILSKIFLYPAIVTLGIGIFIGAIWANMSWGSYWSWDPKETWALITFMIYAIILHTTSIPKLNKPLAYHIFMALAFLSIIMTFFGVNYILGGMHSYA